MTTRTVLRLVLIPIVLLAAVPLAVVSQTEPTPSPQVGAVAAPRSSTEQLSELDRKFVQDAAMSDLMEIELGGLAVQKAEADAVRQFGQRTVEEHTQVHQQLQAITQPKRIALPDVLDARRRQDVERLKKLPAAQFDVSYMKLMVEQHQQGIRAFRKEIAQGSDADIKSFASTTLLKIHDHLAMAQGAFKTAKGAERPRKPSATTAEPRRSRDRTTGAVGDDAGVKSDPEATGDFVPKQ